MSKRLASSSPAEAQHDAKKPKLESVETLRGNADDNMVATDACENAISDHEAPENIVSGAIVAPDEPSSIEDKVQGTEVKQKRKAGDDFDKNWLPEEAKDNFRPPAEAEKHWGIVPRSTNYRPTEPQPSARASNAAVVPPLWEDRKGGVRLKRPSRYIKGYDQAQHMYLRLMDLRPDGAIDPKPRREPIHYWYTHGMIVNWESSGALNDINKALKGAIRTNSNKESAWQPNERNALARICGENPDDSIWDIAVHFNDEVYPLAKGDTEEGRYPSGRFIESVVHEYRTYKSAYDKGEAPNEKTKKDVQLEQLYEQWKDEERLAKEAEAKKTEKGVKKTRTKDGKTKKPTGKMSETAGVTKEKRKRKHWTKMTAEDKAAMAARTDAFAQKIAADEAAEEAAPNTLALPTAEPAARLTPQPRLSGNDEELFELAGGYNAEDVQPSSRLSASSRAVIASPSYGSGAVVKLEEQVQDVQTLEDNNEAAVSSSSSVVTQTTSDVTADTETDAPVESTVVETQTIIEADVMVETSQVHVAPVTEGLVRESRAAAEQVIVKDAFVGKVARDLEIHENYNKDEVL